MGSFKDVCVVISKEWGSSLDIFQAVPGPTLSPVEIYHCIHTPWTYMPITPQSLGVYAFALYKILS